MAAHRYDFVRDVRDTSRFRIIKLALTAAAVMVAVDLRPFCPPVDDQGPEGSCTGNAGVGLAEFDWVKQGNPFDKLSRAFLYWVTRNMEGTASDDSGCTITDTILAWAKFGICDESKMPYIPGDVITAPTPDAYADALPDVAQNYSRVNQSLVDIYACLQHGYPVMFGISVYSSFEDAADGNIPMPDTQNESFLGGHAILLVGYDPATNKFIFRNSWGVEWGQAGYGTLPAAYVLNPDLASDFWVVKGIGISPSVNSAASVPLTAVRPRRGIVHGGFLEYVGDDSHIWKLADALEAAGDTVVRLAWTDNAAEALAAGPVDYWINYSWGKAQAWQSLNTFQGTPPPVGLEITVAGVACWLFGQAHGFVWHEYPNIQRAINFTVTSFPVSDPIRDAGAAEIPLAQTSSIPCIPRLNVNCDGLGLGHISIMGDSRVQAAIIAAVEAIVPMAAMQKAAMQKAAV